MGKNKVNFILVVPSVNIVSMLNYPNLTQENGYCSANTFLQAIHSAFSKHLKQYSACYNKAGSDTDSRDSSGEGWHNNRQRTIGTASLNIYRFLPGVLSTRFTIHRGTWSQHMSCCWWILHKVGRYFKKHNKYLNKLKGRKRIILFISAGIKCLFGGLEFLCYVMAHFKTLNRIH